MQSQLIFGYNTVKEQIQFLLLTNNLSVASRLYLSLEISKPKYCGINQFQK